MPYGYGNTGFSLALAEPIAQALTPPTGMPTANATPAPGVAAPTPPVNFGPIPATPALPDQWWINPMFAHQPGWGTNPNNANAARWRPGDYADSGQRMAAWRALGSPDYDFEGNGVSGQNAGGVVSFNGVARPDARGTWNGTQWTTPTSLQPNGYGAPAASGPVAGGAAPPGSSGELPVGTATGTGNGVPVGTGIGGNTMPPAGTGGTGTTTTTTTPAGSGFGSTSTFNLDPALRSALQQALQAALGQFNNPNGMRYYQGNTVANLTPDEIAAQNMLRGLAGNATGTAGNAMSFLNSVLSGGTNPQLDAMIQSAQRDTMRAATDPSGAFAGIRRGAESSGAYGGSRQGVVEGIALGRLNDTLADQSTQMRYGDYTDSQNRGIQGLGQLGNVLSGATMPATMLAGVGAQNRGQEQARINDNLTRWAYENFEPERRIQNLLQAINASMGLGGSQVNTTQYPDWYMQALQAQGGGSGSSGGNGSAGLGALLGILGLLGR